MRTRSFRGLLVCALLLVAPGTLHAQLDPFAPTDANHPLKRLVDHLNSAEGVELRERWRIDGAIWREPQFALDRDGVRRLFAPAHADIHAPVPFEYDPGQGDQPQNPLVGSAVRVLIPRHYGDDPVQRWIMLAPPGPTNELTGTNQLDTPLLRRGYLVFLQNSWQQGFDKIPNALLDLGRRANQGTRYVVDMLSGPEGLGVLPPHRTYGVGSGRGANVLGLAAELRGVPFDGVLHQNGGSGFVTRGVHARQLLHELRAVDPAHDSAMAEYFQNIGRKMTITRANGTTRTGTISATLDADLRFFFNIPAGAQVLLPIVPIYEFYGVEFRFTGQTFDQNVSGPTITTTTPAGLRSLLADVDPSYLEAVDSGTVLLRDWIPQRPVLEAMLALDPSGNLHTKLLKVQGTRDAVHYPLLEIEYVYKIIGSDRLPKLRYYFVRGGATVTQGTQAFVDATGVVRSLGREINDLDLLISWVETGRNPGDLIVADPQDPTQRITVQGAHQLRLERNPLCYFETIEALPHLFRCRPSARRTSD